MPPTRSVSQLASELGQLGVSAGDTLMVHASLRRLGPAIESGATAPERGLVGGGNRQLTGIA